MDFQDSTLPLAARVTDLSDRLTLDEKISQMVHPAAGIKRLGIPEYNWWNECLHGVARAGGATVFPQAIGLAATCSSATTTPPAACRCRVIGRRSSCRRSTTTP